MIITIIINNDGNNNTITPWQTGYLGNPSTDRIETKTNGYLSTPARKCTLDIQPWPWHLKIKVKFSNITTEPLTHLRWNQSQINCWADVLQNDLDPRPESSRSKFQMTVISEPSAWLTRKQCQMNRWIKVYKII